MMWKVYLLIHQHKQEIKFVFIHNLHNNILLITDRPSTPSSSSSSGGTPSGEHSRLHNWTPFGTILCTKPCRVEAKVGRLQVRLDGTEPGSTWSSSPAAPVGWKTVDGCLKGTGMILWWISLCDMSEQICIRSTPSHIINLQVLGHFGCSGNLGTFLRRNKGPNFLSTNYQATLGLTLKRL